MAAGTTLEVIETDSNYHLSTTWSIIVYYGSNSWKVARFRNATRSVTPHFVSTLSEGNITPHKCSVISVRPNTFGFLLPTLILHACSMSMKRASPTAIYAVSAEFTRQLHCLTLIQSCKTYPTKDDPLVVKLADSGLARRSTVSLFSGCVPFPVICMRKKYSL